MVKEAVEEAKKNAEVLPDAEGTDTAAAEEAGEESEAADNIDDSETVDDSETSQKEEPVESKGFFRKKNKKDKKDEKIEDLTDRLTRQMAEFDNFRKRSEKEKSAMYEIGARDVIEKILPVLDNFERGLKQVGEDEKEDPFVDGIDKVYKQLLTTLNEIGVKPIEAVGNEFNPELHNAVMHEESDDEGENVVAEEFLKGYTYRDTVVRHSMVKVVN
ncbi:MAG: nucleotide exchange factor GrpE [Lachnospiraceae bacterium]